MRPTHLSSLLFASLACVALGCDGGDPPTAPDAGNPVDQCISTADRAILSGTTGDAGAVDGGPVADGGLVDAGLVDAAVPDPLTIGGDCAYACLAELLMADPAPGRLCMETCFAASALGGLSQGCQNCFIEATYCTGNACPVLCLGNDPEMCTACYETYCKASADLCTGL